MEERNLSRVLKFTSPDDASNVHLYEMREEFDADSRSAFFTERIAETQDVCPDPSTRDAGPLPDPDAGPSPDVVCAAQFSDIPSPDEALLGTAIQELIRQQQLVREQMADRVRELAVAIARKIICRVGDQRPDIVVDQVRIALDKVGLDSSLTIRVHPRDAEYLVARKDTILKSLDHIDRVVITGDHSISPGGCVIETDRELIDASIESQLELVELAIQEQESGNEDGTS